MNSTIFYNNMINWLSLAEKNIFGPQAISMLGSFIATYVSASTDIHGNLIIGYTAQEFVNTILSHVTPNVAGMITGAILYDNGITLSFTGKQLSPLLIPLSLQIAQYQGVSNIIVSPPTTLADWIKIFTYPVQNFSNGPQQSMSIALKQALAAEYTALVTKAISSTTTLLTATQVIPPFLTTTIPGVLVPT